jgi:hypothetical protein
LPLNHTSTYANPTDAQYSAIGKAVVEWANIEFLLGVLLSKLLGTPEYLARTYTDSMSASRMQDSITEALEIHRARYHHRIITEDLLNEIRQINTRVTLLRSTRNKIAHFCWARNHDDELYGTGFSGGIASEKKERKDNAILSSEELKKLNESSYFLVENLIKLVEKLPSVKEESLLSLNALQK